MADKPVIGFIGVGLMGHGMAKNIVEKGYKLHIMAHRNRAPVDDLIARGAKEAASPRAMAEVCDIIHICVTASPQVEAIVRGADGILASGKKGLIVVDCSTADPVSTLQLAAELLSAGQAPIGWLTWWVGDAIGVIVFMPLSLMALPSQAQYWSGRRWQLAVPSLLIVGTLMVAIVQNVTHERARIDNALQQLGDQAITDLGNNIALHQEVLEGLRGLVDASEDVTAAEFDTYTDDMLARFPNLQALSWNPLVTESGLAAFEAKQRAQPGRANFTVTERDAAGNLRPVSPRPQYVVVAYIEPLAKNRSALGFDIYSNPVRAAAIEKARDTGRAIATAPIDLVQESGTQKGMLTLLPVYEGGSTPGTEPARRAALRGFVVGVYRLGNLLDETFRGAAWDSVGITLVDVTDRSDPVVIADLPARNSAARGDQVSAGPAATHASSRAVTTHPPRP